MGDVLGPSPVSALYNNLGSNCEKLGQDEQALEYCRKALEINIKVSGHLLTDVADSKYNLVLLQKKRKEAAIARQLLLECEQIYTALYGSDHSKTVACTSCMRS